MKPKTLRLFALAPIVISLLSLLQPFISDKSLIGQLFLTPSTIFGLSFVSVIWFIYFSNYKYSKQILFVQGAFSFVATGFLLIAHFLHKAGALEKFIVAPHSPFLINLTYVFMAGYLIQVLYYWQQHTKLYINICLAIILFMSLLSIFGHVFTFHGIHQNALLLPAPFGAILSYFILTLVIFAHTNRMERLYLNSSIIVSFAILFFAVVGADVVVYKNLDGTVKTSNKIDTTRQILLETYNVDFYLDSAQTAAQTYETTGNPANIALYQSDKQSYLQTIANLKNNIASDTSIANMQQPVTAVSDIGSTLLTTAQNTIDQAQHQKVSTGSHSAMDDQMDTEMDQVLDQIKALSFTYTNQLNTLTEQESSGGEGIILGVSISSALSLLLLIFTPLFIRQTIQKLSLAEASLEESNRSLSEEKTRTEAVLTSIGDGLFAVDTHGNIIVFNKTAESLTTLHRDDVLGRPYNEVLHFNTKVDFTAKALQGQTTHLTHHATLERSNGQTVDVQLSASPVQGKHDSVMGAIVVFRDRSSEQALENAKDDFVSLASHQLRTPATATKQFLAMFLQGYAGHIDEQQRLFLQQAYDNNEIGINIIEDLLNITRLESNTLKVVEEKIELNQFLSKSIEQHRTFAERGRQKLQLVVPQKQVFIKADINLLSMTIDNLITNALKYSDEGDVVTITVRDGAHPTVAVSDQGIGIKKDDLSKIFGRFSRLQDPQKEFVSGTGIGLYLVKKITDKMHATIKVESVYGEGSTFTLTFNEVE